MTQKLTLDLLRSQYRDRILAIASHYGVKNVRVFGSYARGDQTENSDIDFLFTRLPGTDLMDLGGLYTDLESLLPAPIDVVTEGGLYPEMKDRILSEAVPL